MSGWPRNLRILWIGQFLVTAGLTVLVPLMPICIARLGVSDAAENRLWSGLCIAAPAFTLMLAAPVWGRLGDLLGRKAMVVRALVGIATSVGLMSMARTPQQLFLARLLQGAFGGVDDAAAAFLTTQTPRDHRGKALGALQTATAAGALVGPIVGGFASDRVGFSPLTALAGLLIAASSLCAAALLTETQTPAASARQQGALRSALGVITRRETCPYVVGGMLVQTGTYGIIAIFATHVSTLYPKHAGGVVGSLHAATWMASMIGAAWWGARNDRWPTRVTFCTAALGCAVAVALQPVAPNAEALVALRVVQGFCVSAIGQSVYLQVSGQAREGMQGICIGVANSALTMGQIIGALLGSALAAALPTTGVFACMAGCFALGGATAMLAPRVAPTTVSTSAPEHSVQPPITVKEEVAC
ncbi:MAG: MFS transporter [Proteobacteria bacterium]|nr:MFS transporter [Pseudomonadota bacterium]